MKIFTFVVGIVLLISSCSNHNRKYLDQLSKLRVKLDSANSAYTLVDSSLIASIRGTVKTNTKKASKIDDKEFRKTVIYYSHTNKTLKQVFRMDRVIRVDFAKSVKQIDALYNDIENNILDENVFKNYISDEEIIAQSVIDRMEFNSQRMQNELVKFDSLNPIILEHLK